MLRQRGAIAATGANGAARAWELVAVDQANGERDCLAPQSLFQGPVGEISTSRVGYGTASVTFKGLGVVGETDWEGVILTTDDGGVTWYAPVQTCDSLLHEITVAGQVFPAQYALVTPLESDPPHVIDAVYNDDDDDGVVEAGETLTLIFDRGLVIRPVPSFGGATRGSVKYSRPNR